MESHPAVLPVFLQRRRNHSFVYLCSILADNYLEKRAEELRNPRPKVVRHHPSLDASRVVSEEDLLIILEIVPWVASGMNAQPLRFRLVTGADATRVHPLVKLGAEVRVVKTMAVSHHFPSSRVKVWVTKKAS